MARGHGVLLRLLLPLQPLGADHAAEGEAREVHVLPALRWVLCVPG